jgi:hypothetical protein
VRVIVVSPQPALSLALSTQLPSCDAHAASRIDDVLGLASAGAVVLLDVGPSETDEWLSSLVTRGLDTGIVVVGQPMHRVSRSNIEYLPRPFSLADLSQAFERIRNLPSDPSSRGEDPSEGRESPATATPTPGEPESDDERGRHDLQDPVEAGPRTSTMAKAPWERAAKRLRNLISEPDGDPSQSRHRAETLSPEPEAELKPGSEAEPGSERESQAVAEPPRSPTELEPVPKSEPEPRRTLEPAPDGETEEPGPGTHSEADREKSGSGPEPEPGAQPVASADVGRSAGGLESPSPKLPTTVDEAPPATVTDGPGARATPTATSAEMPLQNPDAAAPTPPMRMSWFKRRRPAVRAADPHERRAKQDEGPLNAASFAKRLREGLAAAHQLEELLSDHAVLADVAQCGKALLEEVNARMIVGGSAVALRGTGNDLQIVATAADAQGVNDGHITTDHPFVRAAESRGGALLLAPTDEVRGLLAGIPVSHWPVLLAATIAGDGQPDGIVLVGQPPPGDPTDVDRLYEIVSDAADLLRLAAILRRLPHPNDEHLNFLHTWMRQEAP